MGGGRGEFEADEPVAGGAVAVHFGSGEFPTAGGLQSEIGEILARAGGFEFGLGDISRGLDVNVDSHANFAMDGATSLFGDVGQDLVEDFAASGRGIGGLGRVGGRKRICSQCRLGGGRS